MNSSILNYHLATARTADIERGTRHLQVREPAQRRRRGFAAGGRRRRAALVARSSADPPGVLRCPAVVHVGGASLDVFSAEFAAAVGAALLAGVVRGFSGFGSALILSPSLSALYGPEVAVPVALLLEFALAGPFVPPALHVDRPPAHRAALRRGGGHGPARRVPPERRRRADAAVGDLRAGLRRRRDPRLRLALSRPAPRRRDRRDRRAQRAARRRDGPLGPARDLLRALRLGADRDDAGELHGVLRLGRRRRPDLVRDHGDARRPAAADRRRARRSRTSPPPAWARSCSGGRARRSTGGSPWSSSRRSRS